MPPSPAAAVMFDMDGLLIDTERLYRDAFLQARAEVGLAPDEHVYLATIGLRGDLSPPIIEPSLGGKISLGEFNIVWDKHVSDRLAEGIPAKDGALELVEALSAQGVPMGVATSTGTKKALGKLERTGFLSHLSHVIGGDQVARPKPDPEVYLTLAATLGVDPAQCVAFEDSNTGTRAAHASGAFTVQVPDLTSPCEETRALGHQIAGSLLEAAAIAGLIPARR